MSDDEAALRQKVGCLVTPAMDGYHVDGYYGWEALDGVVTQVIAAVRDHDAETHYLLPKPDAEVIAAWRRAGGYCSTASSVTPLDGEVGAVCDSIAALVSEPPKPDKPSLPSFVWVDGYAPTGPHRWDPTTHTWRPTKEQNG